LRLDAGRRVRDPAALRPYAAELTDYLEGRRQHFEFAIDWSRFTGFQRQVLRATRSIPYGRTRTYADLAARVGKPAAARAVGRVQVTNPLPIVIPCHRVVGSDGKLHGYGGGEGLKTKRWLLDLEARIARGGRSPGAA
jgi:O-6-methylguanine DNA methyltransferase